MKKLMSIALLALLGATASTNAFLFWGRGCGGCNWYGNGYGRACCSNDYCGDSCGGCGGYGYGYGYGRGWGGFGSGGYYGGW